MMMLALLLQKRLFHCSKAFLWGRVCTLQSQHEYICTESISMCNRGWTAFHFETLSEVVRESMNNIQLAVSIQFAYQCIYIIYVQDQLGNTIESFTKKVVFIVLKGIGRSIVIAGFAL